MSGPEQEARMRELAAQLACPTGEEGLGTGRMMERSNAGMVRNTIGALEVCNGDRVLELGHALCTHLVEVLGRHADTTYHGLEISATMHAHAVHENQGLVDDGRAVFSLYDGRTLPFADASFARAFTVNTLYFWDDPVGMLTELHRVLAPGGRLCIAYALRHSMERLPFTRYGFRLYADADLADVVVRTPFGTATYAHHREQLTDKEGRQFARDYTVATLTK